MSDAPAIPDTDRPQVAVVRFDAELLVHRAASTMGCGAGVVTNEPVSWNGDIRMGTHRVVRRCTLTSGHFGAHTVEEIERRAKCGSFTACGLSLSDGAWIDWKPGPNDPECPACHGVEEDEQEALYA